jgi:2-dehydro-3-deoxyphosphogluconate aldolase/(4S)-4-hydroxy-2-oxoglutarate aldolase
VNRKLVQQRIGEIGIVPSIRASTAEDAIFAAEAVSRGGIPIIEVMLTVPDAYRVISHLVQEAPDVITGAGGVLDIDMAQRCLEAGAQFLSSDCFEPEVVKFATSHDMVAIPGTLTPTDIFSAWKLGPDFVKVVPCGHVGADSYIRALKAMFPTVPMIAAGGVNQQNASKFILAGAAAIGIGAELIPGDAVWLRQPDRIAELARRFTGFVANARAHQSS